METLISLVEKGLLSLTQAAEEAHMTTEEFEKKTGLNASIKSTLNFCTCWEEVTPPKFLRISEVFLIGK